MESELTIRDVMTREYVGVSEADAVQGAVEIMRDERVGSVVVLRGTDPVGVMTEWDVIVLVADGTDLSDTSVESAMSAPVVSMDIERRLNDAVETMSRHDIRRLLATDAEGEVVGVLTERDVIAASASLSGPPTRSEQPTETDGFGEPGETNTTDTMDAEFAGQSICEMCGSLTHDLTGVNGQLVCGDCRQM